MSYERRTVIATGPKIKISLIKCGGDGRKDAYKYLARLTIANIKKS